MRVALLGAALSIGLLVSLASEARAATCRASGAVPHSKHRAELLHEALELAHAGKYADARALYLFQLARAPDDAEAIAALAHVDGWEGCYALAEKALRGLLTENPDDDETRGSLIDILSWQSRWKDAERLLASGLALNPTSVALITRASRLALWRGDATEAARLADLAVSLDPKDPELREMRDDIVLGTASADFRLDAYTSPYPSVYTYGANVLQRWHKLELGLDSHIVERAGGSLGTPIVDGLRTLNVGYHPTYGMSLHLDLGYGRPAVAVPQYSAHGGFSSTLVAHFTGSFDAIYWGFTEGRTVVILNPALSYEVNDSLEVALRWYTAILAVASGQGHPYDSSVVHAIDGHVAWRPKKHLMLSADYSYGAQLEASPTLTQIFSYTSHVVAVGGDYLLRRDLGIRGLLGLERRASDSTSEVIWIESLEVGGYVRW